MTLKSIVIHEITKEAGSTNSASIYLSNDTLDVTNENVKRIVNSLEESFARKTVKRAKFADGGFQDRVESFESFEILSLSRNLTENLKDRIDGISAAKGGYLVFAEYASNHDFLALFLVRNTDGSKLTPNAGSWDLNSTQYLDVEHFAMGAKINLSILNGTSEDRYVSLVRGNTDISHYFEGWIGLDDTKQENKDAEALYDVANQIDLPAGVTREELKKKIFDYTKSHRDRVINLRELSQYLYADENKISNFCSENNIDIDGEFKLTGSNLQKFYKVSVKADNIELTAPRSSFNPNAIRIVDGSVVINSPGLVQQIQNALNNHGRTD
ncbi:MAG: hypothetical protein JU82_00325 [Sulfuricurvum sp. MLSB]|uniref:nucleoid-associated protein n=1 Tax=unclassified Sulfuricurvum TaxID=2632390 RepID=UPI000502E95E|nr:MULTISPECIES: nucleoid-associated protein [unclassified Sulfuricurvum]KFN40860.1 MAG: hypothetical protein JU82_00325 [Sulfuricurvum sp. MLSB]